MEQSEAWPEAVTVGNTREGRKACTAEKIRLGLSGWLVRCVVCEGKGNMNKSGVQNWVDVGALLFGR